MLMEPTLEKLHDMRMGAMAEAWLEQQRTSDIGELSFDERFGLLVDAEFLHRENRRLDRLLREAKLRIRDACVEDIDFGGRRGVEKTMIRQLATCKWLGERLNVLITGPTGVGKTYIACALGQQSCRKGYRVVYRRLPRLLDEMALAHADGTFPRLLVRLARIDLLVLDDWGLVDLKPQQRHDLLEVLEDRYGERSTIVTSQLPVSKWHDHLGDPSLADAILDRVVHNAYKIELKGPSRRKEKKDTKNKR